MKKENPIDYSQIVNYAGFDSFKVECQEAGRQTAHNLDSSGFKELTWSRGESAYIVKTPWKGKYIATVEEGLGTKDIPADRMAKQIKKSVALLGLAFKMQNLMGRSFFKEVAQCNVAMAVNDLITSGASPLTFMLHLAVSNANWFKNKNRRRELIQGTQHACNLADALGAEAKLQCYEKLLSLGQLCFLDRQLGSLVRRIG